MKIRAGHVIAYLLGVSSNARIDLLHELSPKVRVALEVALALLPIVVVSVVVLQPVAATVGKAVADRLIAIAFFLGMSFWFATIALRNRRRKPIPVSELLLFVFMFLLMTSGRKKPLAAVA
jgi:hypothetical protein